MHVAAWRFSGSWAFEEASRLIWARSLYLSQGRGAGGVSEEQAFDHFPWVVFNLMILVLSCILVREGDAQVISGDLVGTVLDKSGAAVQGASIEAVNVETGVKYATKGNDTGEYRFTNLPVGAYNVSASATNFATTTINGLRVELNKTVTLPITLEVKSVANTIEVSGAAQPFGYHHGSGNQ